MQSKEKLNGREVISKIILDKPDCLLLIFAQPFKNYPFPQSFLVFSLFLPSPGQSFWQDKNYLFFYSQSKEISLSLTNGFQTCITEKPTTGFIQTSVPHLQTTKTHRKHNKVIHYILQVYGFGQLFCYIHKISQNLGVSPLTALCPRFHHYIVSIKHMGN